MTRVGWLTFVASLMLACSPADAGDGESSGSTSGDGDGDGDGDCPAPGDAIAEFSVGDEASGAPPSGASFTATCTIEAGVEEGSTATVSLRDCTGGPAESIDVSVTTNPGPYLFVSPGTEVTLRVTTHIEPPYGWTFNFVLSAGDTPLLAGYDDYIVPSGPDPVVTTLENIGCEGTAEECDSEKRVALRVSYGGDERVIPDGGSAYVGQLQSYLVAVGEATERMMCLGDSRYRAVYVLVPEG